MQLVSRNPFVAITHTPVKASLAVRLSLSTPSIANATKSSFPHRKLEVFTDLPESVAFVQFLKIAFPYIVFPEVT